MSMNKILVIGNLGSDPEMRYTPSGDAVTSFSVATNRRYTNRDGQTVDETEVVQGIRLASSSRDDQPVLDQGKQSVRRGQAPKPVLCSSRWPDPVFQ